MKVKCPAVKDAHADYGFKETLELIVVNLWGKRLVKYAGIVEYLLIPHLEVFYNVV